MEKLKSGNYCWFNENGFDVEDMSDDDISENSRALFNGWAEFPIIMNDFIALNFQNKGALLKFLENFWVNVGIFHYSIIVPMEPITVIFLRLSN